MQRTPTQCQRQARLFDADEDAALVAPPPIPTHPTAIVMAVSGGIDSSGAAIWARRRWPALPIILLHNHLEQFDWPQTDTIIGAPRPAPGIGAYARSAGSGRGARGSA